MGTLTETLKTSDTLNFFFNLNGQERLALLECAFQGLSDELSDGSMELDNLSEEELEKLYQKLSNFMEG